MQVTTGFGTVKILMLKGEQGEAGKNGEFENLTDEQKAAIKGDLASFYRKEEGYFTTTSGMTTLIEIPIQVTDSDMLLVDVEGLSLMEGRDYTRDGQLLTLVSPIVTPNTTVHFTAMQAVAGTVEDYQRVLTDIAGLIKDELKAEIEQEFASGIAISSRKLEGSYTTRGTTANITIPVEYAEGDILFVDVNGLDLNANEYTISGNKITLNTPIASAGAVVHFVAIRLQVTA